MTKNRLEAFSDGVIAIILTIMVLELKVVHVSSWADIYELYPVFISYALSFIFIAIYWVNHHHLVYTLNKVNSSILWFNTLLLFSLSLIPWGTGLMGENHFAQNTVIVYTFLCILPALAFSLLSKAIIKSKDPNREAQMVLKKMKPKERISTILYLGAFFASFVYPLLALVLVFIVSCVWVFPSKEIEELFD